MISAFDVDLGDQDHIFHCRFKEKNIHGLLIHVKEERILRKEQKNIRWKNQSSLHPLRRVSMSLQTGQL